MTKYFSQSQSKNKLSVKIFKYEDRRLKMFVMFEILHVWVTGNFGTIFAN